MAKNMTDARFKKLQRMGECNDMSFDAYIRMMALHSDKGAIAQESSKIAQIIFGAYDWHGARGEYCSVSGLKNDVNAWCRNHGPDSHWHTKRVSELPLGDFTSMYYVESF